MWLSCRAGLTTLVSMNRTPGNTADGKHSTSVSCSTTLTTTIRENPTTATRTLGLLVNGFECDRLGSGGLGGCLWLLLLLLLCWRRIEGAQAQTDVEWGGHSNRCAIHT